MTSKITVTFHGNDLIFQLFLQRYIEKAKRVPGYEDQVLYLEEISKKIKEETNNGVIPRIPKLE